MRQKYKKKRQRKTNKIPITFLMKISCNFFAAQQRFFFGFGELFFSALVLRGEGLGQCATCVKLKWEKRLKGTRIEPQPTSSSLQLVRHWVHRDLVSCSWLEPQLPPAMPEGWALGQSCCCVIALSSRICKWCSAIGLQLRVA